MHYNGWTIYGSGDRWEAWRWGVRMRANSLSLIRRMIDLRPAWGRGSNGVGL